MAQIDQLGSIATTDLTVKNYSGSDIADKLVVILDTTNLPDGSGTPIGVTLPASDVKAFGVAVGTLPTLKMGRIRVAGAAVCVASGTIHMGDVLMSDSAGKVLAQTAGKYQIGIAMSEAVTTEDVLVFLQRAKNA